jgi:hypothetical protein
MYGAIIGDLAGSIYEYEQTKKIKPVYTTKIIENNVFYSTEYGIDDKLIKEVDKRLPNQFVYILKKARFK